MLDVRQDDEFRGGHVPGARHAELGSLRETDPPLPAGPLTVMCSRGERAMTAASLLARRGRPDIEVLLGGPEDWMEASGVALERV